MNDKSWVGQWLAIMFGGALIVAMFVQLITEATIPQWFIGLAIGFVGVHRVSREIEKRK